MNTEEHDDLWDLLGKARKPDVSPFFSRNVLRAIREERSQPGVLSWFVRAWRVTAAAVCALLIGGFALWQGTGVLHDPTTVLAEQFATSPDFQVVSDLEELMDSEKIAVWLPN